MRVPRGAWLTAHYRRDGRGLDRRPVARGVAEVVLGRRRIMSKVAHGVRQEGQAGVAGTCHEADALIERGPRAEHLIRERTAAAAGCENTMIFSAGTAKGVGAARRSRARRRIASRT